MGVPGLTTLLDINNHILLDVLLRDVRVVIDGNNLYHFLYHRYSVPTAYGGDYDVFYTAAHSFFSILSKCGITPIVVFDGPYDPSDRKINTSIKRAKERLRSLYDRSSKKYSRMTPLLAQCVFLDVLNDLDVDHVTCDSEADKETAALANALECPVLTNDSDFFVFEIKVGVILLDYVNLELRRDKDPNLGEGKSKRYIKVQMYVFENFVKMFPGIGRDHMALFATVMGNDKVEAETFETFFSAVRLPFSSVSEKVFHSQKQHRMLGVLTWLGKISSFDNAIEKILGHCPKDERKKLRKILMDSVNTYRNIDVSETLPYLTDKWEGHSDTGDVPDSIGTVSNQKLPMWFIQELRRGRLSPLAVNVAVCHRAILLPQPENVSQPSTHWCAEPLRRLVYAVVLRGCCECERESDGNSPVKELLHVEEIDRHLKTQRRTNIQTKLELNSGRQVPSLVEIQRLSAEDRTSIVLEGLGVTSDMLQKWPSELQLYMGTIMYLINNAEPKLNWLHVSTLVLCLLKLVALDKIIFTDTLGSSHGSQASTKTETRCQDSVPTEGGTCADKIDLRKNGISDGIFERIRSNCSMQEILCAKDKLEKFSLPSKGKGSGEQSADLDYSILHTFSQLQSCIMAASAFNQVMALPLATVRLGDVCNSTFLYNMYRDLRSRTKPDLYVFELLERSEKLVGIFEEIKGSIVSCLKPGSLIMDFVTKSKHSKKAARNPMKKNDKKTATGHSTVQCEDVKVKPKHRKEKLVAKCDLANKFGCLLLSDDDSD